MEFTFQVATRTPTNLGGFPDGLRAARVGAVDVDAGLREPGFDLPTPAAPGGNNVQFLAVLQAELGDLGRGARSAVGMAELPSDISVEIEAVVLVG
jgi:hypothetical protein